MNPCTTPVKFPDADGDNRWWSIHKRFLSECREKDPDVIFIGDCVLQQLQQTDVWNTLFAPMHCLNFSIYHDQTQHTLWRLQNGELDGVHPRCIVLMIGTNNVPLHTAAQISEGILAIVQCIRSKLGNDVYIVLPTLLPRGQKPNHCRERITEINRTLTECCSSLANVQVVPIDRGLVHTDGSISHHDMHDYLNLTSATASKVFEPLHDLLLQVLNENEKEKDLTPSE